MVFFNVVTVDDVVILTFQIFQHSRQLFGRILTVIVEDSHVTAAALHETGQDRIVLSEIPAQMHEDHGLRKPLRKLRTHSFAIVLGTVVDETNFEGCRSKHFCDLLNELANGATSVVNWNYQR